MDKELCDAAIKAMKQLSRPYVSGYHVGAAVRTRSGKIYRGGNIEFDTHTDAVHAEKAAVLDWYLHGKVKDRPVSIAVCTKEKLPWWPCGLCRQMLYEVASRDLVVMACNEKGWVRGTMLSYLLPEGFKRRRRE